MTKTMSSHTPGPWDVFGAQDASSDEWRALTVGEAAMPFMRVCFMPSDGTETIMANARLIASAPDLLAAAQAAWNCIGELPPTQARVEVGQMLCAAIKKATEAEA